MAIATGTALAMGGAALAGGIAGSMKDKKETSQTSTINIGPETNAEREARLLAADKFAELNKVSETAFSEKQTRDYLQQSLSAQTDLAGFFKQLSESGGLPNAQDVAQAGGFAEQIYNPQKVALQQSAEDQANEYAKLQARLGRGPVDPILQAKLRTGLMRQTASLEADKGAFASNLALQLPGQRLQYAQGGASILKDLASQAFQNRAMLFEMGSGVQQAERNFRLQSAGQTVSGTELSGGGLKGGILGGLAGAQTGAGLASAFGGFSGGAVPGATASGGVSGVGPVANGNAYGRNIGLGYQRY